MGHGVNLISVPWLNTNARRLRRRLWLRIAQTMTSPWSVVEALEGTAAATAAHQATAAEVEPLRDIAAAGRRGNDASAEVAKNNAYFHNTIFRAAHNRYLLRTLAAPQDSLTLLGQSTLSLKSRVRATFDEHGAIVVAIATRDGARSEDAARVHIRAAHKARPQLLFETETATGDLRAGRGGLVNCASRRSRSGVVPDAGPQEWLAYDARRRGRAIGKADPTKGGGIDFDGGV